MSCFVCSYLTDCCKRVGLRVRACCNTSLSRGFLLQMQSHNSPYLPTPVCMMVLFQWTTLLKQLIQGEAKRFLNIYIAWTVHYTPHVMYWVNPCVDSYMPRKSAEMEHIMVNLKQSAAQLFSLLCCGFALPVMLSCGACGFTQARVTTRTLPIPPEHAGMPVLSVYMCDLAEGQGIMWNWPEVNTLIRWKPWGKAAQVVERESDPPCLSATGSPGPLPPSVVWTWVRCSCAMCFRSGRCVWCGHLLPSRPLCCGYPLCLLRAPQQNTINKVGQILALLGSGVCLHLILGGPTRSGTAMVHSIQTWGNNHS